MLNIKVRSVLDSDNIIYNEIDYYDIYFEPNGKFISGVTSQKYLLMDKQDMYIGYNEGEYEKVTVRTENVTRQGYITIDFPYRLSITDKIGDEGDVYYFTYDDGITYYAPITASTITINGKTYSIQKSGRKDLVTTDDYPYITIKKKFYIEDGKINIMGTVSEVYLDLTNTSSLDNYVTFRGKNYPIFQYDFEHWENVTKFTFNKESDTKLVIDNVKCTSLYYYLAFNPSMLNKKDPQACCEGNELHVISDTVLKYEDEIYEPMKSGDVWVIMLDEPYEIKSSSNISYSDRHNADAYTYFYIEYNGEQYVLDSEWRDTDYSNQAVHIYYEPTSCEINEGDIIHAKLQNALPTDCGVMTDEDNKKYISWCGNKYYIAENDTWDFVVVYGKEYELVKLRKDKNDENKFYAYLKDGDGIEFFLCDKGLKKCSRKSLNPSGDDGIYVTSYPLVSYEYVVVGAKKYKIEERSILPYEATEPSVYEIASIDQIEDIKLIVAEKNGNNMLRCVVDGDDESSYLANIIGTSSSYSFYLDKGIYAENRYVNNTFNNILRVYNPSRFVAFNIPMSNNIANNLNQEQIVEDLLFTKEMEKAINPIVDMEKDIYYPAVRVGDKRFKLLNEIQFNLHFRTRDLETWKVKEDLITNRDSDNLDLVKCNWNLFDDYYLKIDSGTPKEQDMVSALTTSGYSYVQPSDLLYYLNFDDDDVFYQKSKIAKSFLRLSFFDSNDPKTQSMLASSTIFMNEHTMYNTYINSSNQNGIEGEEFYFRDCETELSGTSLITDFIKVNSEHLTDEYDPTNEEETKIIYDFGGEEKRRIDATLNVKNKYESTESSEGFYLYMFKDYATNLSGRTIYLKVEFNHAGEGKTVHMTLPYKNENGERTLCNFSGETTEECDRETFKKGYGLRELYDNLYIELKVIYDKKLRKYVYYLPKNISDKLVQDNKLIFNLYEIKIKDESLEDK